MSVVIRRSSFHSLHLLGRSDRNDLTRKRHWAGLLTRASVFTSGAPMPLDPLRALSEALERLGSRIIGSYGSDR
jgi:hypothetical protein